MKKTDTQFPSFVDFRKQNPEMLIDIPKLKPFYEKAFLSREDVSKTEYAQNTTTWD